MQKWCWSLVLLGALSSADVLAWGGDGHRIVAAMADRLIANSNAQRQVAALLLPGESLENIANWPDCVKGNFCGEQTPEMLDYVAANPRHDQYHYTNIAFQQEHYQDGAIGSAPNDIVQTLKQAIAVLQGREDAQANPHHFSRRQALILLTHLGGDIGQPLHVGEAYIDASGAFAAPPASGALVGLSNTRGGNRLLLDEGRPAAATPLTFHSYWDSGVVAEAMRSAGAATPQQLAQTLLAERPRPASAAGHGDPVTWPYQWADATLQVARLAYAGVTPGRKSELSGKDGLPYTVWTLNLPPHYHERSAALARAQLRSGGYSLAALLQAIWP